MEEIDRPNGGEAPESCPEHEPPARRWLSVVEALLLGIVAIATAWGGYQAARWSGLQATKFNEASTMRVQADLDSTRAGQLALYDVLMFNQWLDAQATGRTQSATNFEQHFRAEFRPAFQAWLATDPLHNPQAPSSPIFMPQYKLTLQEQANQLEANAIKTFGEGEAANRQSESYVLNAVFLATALFFLSIGQRFQWLPVRAAVLVAALGMVVFGIYHLLTYPVY
ncbi:MAG TPA: hypothetical protein VFZ25_03720 [Chloroflexota bacterium]|nr:hypothetical protein [Chloroflexota bacterium]